jgi:hypothetical protein
VELDWRGDGWFRTSETLQEHTSIVDPDPSRLEKSV